MEAVADRRRDWVIPVIVGATCALHGVEPQHYEYLYRLQTTGQNSMRWRTHGAYLSQQEFVESMQRDVMCHYLILSEGRPVGYVVAYAYNARNGFSFIGVILDEDVVGHGIGGEAGALFIDHLFATYPLRKIYVEVPEFTVAAIEASMEGFFWREGIFRKHFLAGGHYWDQHLFATYRESWTQALPAILGERQRDAALRAPVNVPQTAPLAR